MDFKRNPLLLLLVGFVIGIVVAEAVYYFTTPLVLKDGSVSVLTDRGYYPTVSGLISSAQDSVHVAMFSANYQNDPQYADGPVNRLLEQLVSARNKGVDVIVVMDEWPEGNEKAKRYLEKNNIPVTLHHSEGTLHAKLIIIDRHTTVVGSSNWSFHSLDKNHEVNVIVSDKRVAERFEEYFTSLTLS